MSDHDHHHDEPPIPQHLIDEAEAGCEESRFLINRRSLLGMSGGLFAWAHMPRLAHADDVAVNKDPRLIVVLLRGGMDGLHVAPPLLEGTTYTNLRGGIALDVSTLPKLSSDFGFNPVMPNFLAMYNAKEAALVQAIAPPLRRRSHFEGLYNIEAGLPGVGPRNSTSGWLNRLLQQLPVGDYIKAPLNALATGPTPLILAGAAPVLSWINTPRFTPALDKPLSDLYAATNPTLKALFESGKATNDLALSGQSLISGPQNGISAVRTNFRAAGRMMRDPQGPRIAVLDINGWDTHVGLTGILNNKLADLDAAMLDLKTELSPVWANTAVICVTEMGRTAAVNGNLGTDHGDASVAFLLGGAIAGGKVWGDWPGLAQNSLTDGRSLRATTDMRTVFKGLLADHLGVPTKILDTIVFPESSDAPAMKDLLASPYARDDDPEKTGRELSSTGAGSSLADFRQSYGVG